MKSLGNPVLVEAVRGNWVENVHRGSVVVCDSSGRVHLSLGDPDCLVLPRSAIKPIQALALFRSGAVDQFGIDEEEIAIACASHIGDPRHLAIVSRLLSKLSLTSADLECGAHPPISLKSQRSLLEAGAAPSALHNCCSGKHTGMLADALALKVPTKGYVRRDHAVQNLVKRCIEEVSGASLSSEACGVDGCSIPTWAIPLSALGTAFARMSSGQHLAPDIALASKRIFHAVSCNPFLIRGDNTLDSEVMNAFGGRLVLKYGADGVYCGAFLEEELGFALKIDDGSLFAAEILAANIVLAVAKIEESQRSVLEKWSSIRNVNWREIEVGRARCAVKLLHQN